ncbi:phosphatase PAP2 family protein [Saccharothrix australiensis]|uniref:phosphatase PAP2 family protein n=1 Tax=Saccharothrix australiensis TaxID=2072 RepID=UPI001FE9CE8F|nr:phosphatase PAP2 family protein [Saccharothrix australiensis]
MDGTAASGSGLYDGVVEFAGATPRWFQGLFALYTELGLLVFGALFVVVWWRARGRNDPRATARALLAPAATVLAYVVSELLKTVVDEDRPCRGLPAEATVVACPGTGDWSFPSNHATIAGAAAVGLVLARRALLPWVAALAVLMAFSRVFVGVHYPHDVLVGLLLGAVAAWVTVRLCATPVTALVVRLGGHPLAGRVLYAAPPARAAGRRAPIDQATVRLDRTGSTARRRPDGR